MSIEIVHAPHEVTEYGKTYSRGEFLPFYVPRPEMPQIDEIFLTNLIAIAEPFGCGIDTFKPHDLHFHQRINVNKAESMPLEVKMKPIVISRDGYVLDGNHRLWRHLHDNDALILAIQINLPFEGAISWLKRLPFVWEIKNHPQEQN